MKKTLVTLLTILAVTNVFAKPSMRVLGSSTLGKNGVTKSTFPWEINSMNDAFTLVWFDMPDGSYRHATVRVKYGSDPLTVICNGLVYKVRANDHNRNDMICEFPDDNPPEYYIDPVDYTGAGSSGTITEEIPAIPTNK